MKNNPPRNGPPRGGKPGSGPRKPGGPGAAARAGGSAKGAPAKGTAAKSPYRGPAGARASHKPASAPVSIQHKPSKLGATPRADGRGERLRPDGVAPARGNHRPLANVRAVAARTISRVLRGRSLDDALEPASRLRLAADAAMVRTLAYGVLRELSTLQWISAQLLDKPLAADDDISALILVGIHQLRTLHTPAHAAIHETVDAVEILKQPYAHGLVNAVLRRYVRDAAALEQRLPNDAAVRHSHPLWLVEKLQHDWPQRWEEVLAANNRQGPLTLRVNRRRLSRDE